MEPTTLDQLLVYAAMANRIDLIQERLARGASPLYVDEKRDSAIMQACYRGFSEAARLLLAAGADATRMGPDRKSAADYALNASDPAMLEVLRDYGLLPVPKNQTSPVGMAALHLSEEPPSDCWFGPNDKPFNWLSLPQDASELEVLAPFEANCIVDCCGMDAYNFSSRFICHLAPNSAQRRCLIGHLERLSRQEIHEVWRIRLQLVVERIRNLMDAQ